MLLSRTLWLFAMLSMSLGAEEPDDTNEALQSMMKSELFTHIDNAYQSDKYESAHWSQLALSTTKWAETGWVFQSFFVNANGEADAACSSVTSIIGYHVNHCVRLRTYSIKFQLTTGHTCSRGVIQYFSDDKCANMVGSSSLETAANMLCHPSQTPHYANMNAHTMLRCTTYNTPIPPAFPDLGITTETFPNKHCNDEPLQYTSVAAGKCIDMGDYYVMYDCTNERPGFYRYGSNTCTGQRLGHARMDYGCMYHDDGDDDYVPTFLAPPAPSVSTTPFPTSIFRPRHLTTDNVFCTAKAPTSAPAGVPTTYPTSAAARSVQFDVEQRLYGLNLATFVQSDLTRTALLTTIANTMSGVVVSDLRDLYVVDVRVYVTDVRRLRSSGRNGGSGGIVANVVHKVRALGAVLQNTIHSTVHATPHLLPRNQPNVEQSIILATYTVNTTTTLSAEQLFAQLHTAVTSGAFNTDLFNNANSAGATDLVGVTSLTVDYPCVRDCVEEHFEWVWWYIVVIAVGGFVLLVLAVFWAVWCFRKCTEKEFWEAESDYDPLGIPDDDRILVF